MTTIELLDADSECEWEALLQESPFNFIYHSIGYRNALRQILPNAAPQYLCAKNEGRLVGIMPSFSMTSQFGTVINSLPFYGSHGQPIVSRTASDPLAIRRALISAMIDLARHQNAVSATVIGHPLDPHGEDLGTLWQANLQDTRIGQITELHPLRHSTDPANALMQMCHSKTRNMVRKGLRGGFSTSWRADAAILADLHKLHQKNMAAIGGLAKSAAVFEALSNALVAGTGWRVWISERDGRLASALLCLYYNATVEYFTPTIEIDYRPEQPLSALIFEAMLDGAKQGFEYWNWGGTWTSQNGVFQFKSRWGTRQIDYAYHIKVFDNSVLHRSKDELSAAFPNFYVVPFSELRVAAP